LIAANRLPVTVHVDGEVVEITESAGGLATSMRQVHDRSGSRWIGWPGDLAGASDAARRRTVADLTDRQLVPIELTPAEVSRYYDGFANGVLWPLCHYQLGRMRRDATQEWEAYRRVNERFADALAAEWQPGDQVWIHDYHLMLVPGMLRRRLPEASIGFFLHIPFPAGEVFRILPWREQVLRGLLGADVVGFHTAEYAHHFRYATSQLVGAEDHGDELIFEDRRIRAAAYPIGIDVEHFVELAGRPEVAEERERSRQSLLGRRVILAVDRLDYTKGIVRRLLAIERLFDRWPQWRERLHLVQVAVPTRERTDQYADFRREVNEHVGRINGRFGTPHWAPVHFVHRSIPDTELVALYRGADVMAVTPERDGMNLVAKEYCASRTDERGVLVLSEFAGAAAELREALLVNPFDIDATAAALRRGLEMNPIEQQARMSALRKTVASGDVHQWAEHFLADLGAAAETASSVGPRVDDVGAPSLAGAMTALRTAPRRVLILDYDGTLVPFAALPDLAFPDDELRGLLAALAGDPGNQLHVVSGRSRGSLDAWLGDLAIGLHAEHGFWSRWPGEAWETPRPAPLNALAPADAIFSDITRRTPGSFVERKGASLAWHYRMAEPLLAARRLDELRHRIQPTLPEELEMLEGNKVIEVRTRGADKRACALRILARADGGAAFAIGDDRTDEDLFAAMPADAITVRVGAGASRARFRIDGVDETRALLRGLL
jgi:trehalose 6-phosphate synthase/phosphatase